MSCCYCDLSESSACVASCWIGFGPICQACRSVSCSAAVRLPSSTFYIICSVRQGSVLGPLLFIVYTADLPTIAEKLMYHCMHSPTTRSCTCTVVVATVQLEHCSAVHCRRRPLDVKKPPQAQQRQNRATVGGTEIQSPVANVRPTGFMCGWPVGLELIAWQFERSECKQTVSTDFWKQALYWSIQRIRGSTKMRYTNLLLTYLLTIIVLCKYYC